MEERADCPNVVRSLFTPAVGAPPTPTPTCGTLVFLSWCRPSTRRYIGLVDAGREAANCLVCVSSPCFVEERFRTTTPLSAQRRPFVIMEKSKRAARVMINLGPRKGKSKSFLRVSSPQYTLGLAPSGVIPGALAAYSLPISGAICTPVLLFWC